MDREQKRQKRKIMEKNTEDELKEIKAQVTQQVEGLKKMYSKKISMMDEQSERLKAEKLKELTNMKIKITRMLIDQEVKGDISNCKHSKKEEFDAYCNARFPTSWFENKHCRVKENFCGICCENEFSFRFEDDRNKCVQECKVANGEIETKGMGSNEIATVEIVNSP